MKIEIKLPDRGGGLEKMRGVFETNISKPIEKIISRYDLDCYFDFLDTDSLSNGENNRKIEIAAGFFIHLDDDPDYSEEKTHYFHFFADGSGEIISNKCPRKEKIRGTWAQVLQKLLKMFKIELEKFNKHIAEIETMGKAIALLK